MEIKKSEKADLQGKKLIFTQIGLILSLLLIYAAFSLNQGTITIQDMAKPEEEVAHELPPVTRPEEEKPQQQIQKVVAPSVSDIIDVVDNNVELEDIDIFNAEADEDLKIFTDLPVGVANDGEIDFDAPVFKAEINPSFLGEEQGEKSLKKFKKWIEDRVKYPSAAEENGVTGTVVLRFTIGADGKIRDTQVISNTDRSLSDEVLRVMKLTPNWKPGSQNGRPVSVYGTVHVTFEL